LPIGSIVLLKNAEKRLMICGWYPVKDEDDTFDYTGILYPEGFINEEEIFLFNKTDVERVDFIGFTDSEYQAFSAAVKEEMGKRDA